MPSPSPIRIFYIEDNLADFIIFKKNISAIDNAHYTLTHAPSYSAAIENIKQEKFDIYFIDYNLDGVKNGFDCVDEMKKHDIHGPFVLLTGITQKKLSDTSIEKGVYDFLIKDEISPFLLERVISGTMRRFKDEKDKLEWQKIEQQKQKMHSLGVLASGIAHELNNMVQPILLAADMIKNENIENKKIAKATDIISRNAKKSKDIISKILSFSRLEDEEMTALEIKQTLHHSLEFIESFIPKSVKIKTNFKNIPSLSYAMISAQGMTHVLSNILINACHAMDNQGEIEISTDSQEGFCILKVKDSGKGIDKAIIDKIFDPFFTTKQTEEGTGLGLSIVHSIIKSWDGNITALSEKNMGTTIEIKIPMLQDTP